MERGSILVALENCKLKQQWHATTHLLETRKTWKLKIPNAGRNGEQQELSFLASWVQNNTANLGDSFIPSHSLNMWPSNHTLRYLPSWAEPLHPPKNMHTSAYKSLIHNRHSGSNKDGEWTKKLCSILTKEYHLDFFFFKERALKSPKDVEEP